MPSLALFAKNQQGYDNLMALVSKAYLEGGENQSIGVSIKDIELHHEGGDLFNRWTRRTYRPFVVSR